MGVRVVKLGFLGLDVVRHEEMIEHYHRVMGLPVADGSAPGATFLACGTDHHALSLHRGERRGYRHVGFQIAGEGPLDDALKALRAAGIAAEIKSDLMPGLPSMIELADPDGFTVYLYRDSAQPETPYLTGGIGPDKLGHVALYVDDARRAAQYYTDTLGFRWSDWLGDFFVFMRCGVDHHSMNFMRSERDGLFHVAFELRDFSHLGRSCDLLAREHVPILWGPGRHGMGHNLFTYHKDPDGNVVELIAELDRMSDEALGYFDPRPYHTDVPQRPKVWTPHPSAANSWGPQQPADMHGD